MGWDKKFLKDPSGNTYERKRKESLSEEQNLIERILETEDFIIKENWTTSLNGIPVITHSTVENYFDKAEGKRHLLEGYAFSKTKKFETSGKRIEINVLQDHNMFLLRGYTRPAMKQTKQDETYKVYVLFDKKTGKILGARDFFCAAGKRGFCKHVAALSYKLAEATMSSEQELPKPISCTEVRQMWGLPSFKSQQDPEKELMKRKPFQELTFEKNLAHRDEAGGRKRKLPTEVSFTYTSRPCGEPSVDNKRVNELCNDLSSSKCAQSVIDILKLNYTNSSGPGTTETPCKTKNILPTTGNANHTTENTCHSTASSNIPGAEAQKHYAQRSVQWFTERIGKITGSKAPALIGLMGRKEYDVTWQCVKERKQEPKKFFKNFERGVNYEDEAATCFSKESGAEVKECGFFCLNSDPNYGASPDRIFQGDSCKLVSEVKTNTTHILSGLCVLETKTRAEGYMDPLSSITGAHYTQVQLQLECTDASFCILQSFVPENKISKYFLITRNKNFTDIFMHVCNAVLNNEKIDTVIHAECKISKKLCDSLARKVPDFESMLPLRQEANQLSKSCKEIAFY